MLRKLILTLIPLALAAAPACGQTRVGLSAFGGVYVPVSDLFDDVVIRSRAVINLGHEPALLVGGRLTVWFRRFGIEAEAGYALSDVDVPQGLVDVGARADAHVFLGSIDALYVIFQAPFSPLSVHLSGGGGIVSRGGAFFDEFDQTTDMAGSLGVGLRFGLGRLTRLRFDVRDYISSFAPARLAQLDSKVQNDVIATVALEFVLSPVR